MVEELAELRDLTLCVFFGNKKIKHLNGGSGKCLAIFSWDSHLYAAASSQGYVQMLCAKDLARLSVAKVKMDRDGTMRELGGDWRAWDGEVRPGHFLADDVSEIRQEWLR